MQFSSRFDSYLIYTVLLSIVFCELSLLDRIVRTIKFTLNIDFLRSIKIGVIIFEVMDDPNINVYKNLQFFQIKILDFRYWMALSPISQLPAFQIVRSSLMFSIERAKCRNLLSSGRHSRQFATPLGSELNSLYCSR